MKKIIISLILICSAFTFAAAQDAEIKNSEASIIVGPPSLAVLFGWYSGALEFALDNNKSLDTEFTYFNVKSVPFLGAQIAEDSDFWLGYIKAGPNYYIDDLFKGLYVGAYLKASYFCFDTGAIGFDETDSIGVALKGGSAGLGLQAGWRGTWGWFSMSLGGGAEYNKAFVELNVDGSDDFMMSMILNSVEGLNPLAFFNFGIALY